MYSTLLAHKKLHIRNFAAESFTFLMRKVSLIIICLLLINPQESDEQKAISFIIWLLWTDIYIKMETSYCFEVISSLLFLLTNVK